MVNLSKKASCSGNAIEKKLCCIFNTCKNTASNGKGRKLMQKCADDTLKSSCDKSPQPYRNSVPYRMDTKQSLEYDSASKSWKHKDVRGKKPKVQVRIPDVSVFDANGNLDTIYDFKFPGDRWRGNQKKDYETLVGGRPDKVITINEKRCNPKPAAKKP